MFILILFQEIVFLLNVCFQTALANDAEAYVVTITVMDNKNQPKNLNDLVIGKSEYSTDIIRYGYYFMTPSQTDTFYSSG